MTGSRRGWWAAAVAVVVAAVWLLGPKGNAPEATGSPQQAPTTLAAPPEPDAPAPAAARDADRGDPPSSSTGEEEVPAQIQQFLAATVYPPTSQLLSPGAQDLLKPNQRYEKPRPLNKKNRDVTFVFTADRYYYTGDKVAHIWLEVMRGNEPADGVRVHRATALAEGEGASNASVDLRLHRDGARWTSDLELEKAFPEHHGTILLEVALNVDGGEVQEEAIRIFTTPPDRIPAQLTGQFLDFVREGSLYVEMGVDVFEPGFFRFDANLYDRNGDPVAFSVFKGNLPEGEQWVPLQFFGKVLRDEGALAPYSVEQIRGYRFLDGQTPDRERMADEPFTHRTAAYDLALFSDEEYTSEHKERMLQLMREDVAAGRTLDVPPTATKPR